jgi:transcriptional regulator with XRE-family HTH domain
MEIFMHLNELFGANCKTIRERKGFTQEKVAEGSELSLSYVSLLELGKANPTLATVEKLAKGLEVDVVDVLSFTHSQTTSREIRERLLRIVRNADDKTLAGLYNAVLIVFKP